MRHPILRQADFVDRNNFADFLNRRGLTGTAVEIGVYRAEFSFIFLDNWQGKKWYGIDPWLDPEGYDEQRQLLNKIGSEGPEADYQYAKRKLKKFRDRIGLLRISSSAALMPFLYTSIFASDHLDFVYIDGDHRPESFRQDLWGWWDRVKPGGILAGHDFLCHPPDPWHEGIQPVLYHFAMVHNLDIFVVTETASMPWSFYLEKPR